MVLAFQVLKANRFAQQDVILTQRSTNLFVVQKRFNLTPYYGKFLETEEAAEMVFNSIVEKAGLKP